MKQPTTPPSENPGSAPAPKRPGDEAPPGTPGTGETVCRSCGGSGQLDGQRCAACEGTGRITVGIGGG